MCPIVAVAAPRWEASWNLYTVRFTSSFNHPYPLFPGRITNLRPLPVMELIDKPIGECHRFVWSAILCGTQYSDIQVSGESFRTRDNGNT